MTKNQKLAFDVISANPGILVNDLAVKLNTTPSGLGLTIASLARIEAVSRIGDQLFPAVKAAAVSASSIPESADQILRDLESAVHTHSWGENPEDKRAAYLAQVGVARIIKRMRADYGGGAADETPE